MLVSESELAAALGRPSTGPGLSSAIQAAQALVASYIGAETLEATPRTERIAPPRNRGTVPLSMGPLTAVSAVTVDGRALNPDEVQAGYWAIGHALCFAAGQLVVVDYVSGWDNVGADGESNLPEALQAAIVMTAANVVNKGADAGGGKTTESIGDYSVSYAASSVTSITGLALIPSDAALLLNRFKRPQL